MTREEASFILANIDRRVCDDELNDALDMAIKALEQEPKTDNRVKNELNRVKNELNRVKNELDGDCISRQAVLDEISKSVDHSLYAYKSLMECVKTLPSVNPQEPTGHWIYSKMVNTGEIRWSECSECGAGQSGCAKRMKYCPNCGAKMQEVQE